MKLTSSDVLERTQERTESEYRSEIEKKIEIITGLMDYISLFKKRTHYLNLKCIALY